jgi:hypothetical protein
MASQSNTSSAGDGVGYPGGIQHTSAPANSSSNSNVPAMGGATNNGGSNSPNIDFIARTSNYMNGKASEGWDIFDFHNSATDMLRSGALQGMDMSNIPKLLSILPSDWQHTFVNDPNGLENLASGIKELTDLAQQVWTTGQLGTSMKDTWFPGGTWQNYQNTYQQANQKSVENNAGTHKDGCADHPDYTGPMGIVEKIGDKATDLGAEAVTGTLLTNPELALPIAGVAVMGKLLMNQLENIHSTVQEGGDWTKKIFGTPTTFDDIKNLFHW